MLHSFMFYLSLTLCYSSSVTDLSLKTNIFTIWVFDENCFLFFCISRCRAFSLLFQTIQKTQNKVHTTFSASTTGIQAYASNSTLWIHKIQKEKNLLVSFSLTNKMIFISLQTKVTKKLVKHNNWRNYCFICGFCSGQQKIQTKEEKETLLSNLIKLLNQEHGHSLVGFFCL